MIFFLEPPTFSQCLSKKCISRLALNSDDDVVNESTDDNDVCNGDDDNDIYKGDGDNDVYNDDDNDGNEHGAASHKGADYDN